MKYSYLRMGPWRVIVPQFHPVAFGHHPTELRMSVEIAKREKASVYCVPPKAPPNPALFKLRSDEVRFLRRNILLDAVLRLVFFLVGLPNAFRLRSLEGEIRSLERRIAERGKEADAPGQSSKQRKQVKNNIKEMKNSLKVLHAKRGDFQNPAVRDTNQRYFLRSMMRGSCRLLLPSRLEKRALREASKIGLSKESRIITLHVRESGYKQEHGIGQKAEADARNSSIENYFPAMDYLVSQGYTVVRLGDPSMKPAPRPGVVDLAHYPKKTGLLEWWCVDHSRFIIGCESGPVTYFQITHAPLLWVNVTDPINSYPYRETDLYIMKKVVQRSSGQPLRPAEMLDTRYYDHLRDQAEFQYIENTEEEILLAVKEMLQWVESHDGPTPLQRTYKEMVVKAAMELRESHSYVRKWGPDTDFLGDGWVAQSYAERQFQPEGGDLGARSAPLNRCLP